MLFILAILIVKRGFKDYKTIKELFNLVTLNKSISKKASLSKIENAIAFNSRFRGLNFYISYFILRIIYNFKALNLTKIYIYAKFCTLLLILINTYLNLLYLKVNIKKHAS
jgi:hypothetical protein